MSIQARLLRPVVAVTVQVVLAAATGGQALGQDAHQFFPSGYGVKEPAAEQDPPAVTVAWRDGKTRITTEKAYLEISSRVQFRFTEELPDDNTQLAGTAVKGDARGSFRVRRAKFKLEGWVLERWLAYETQVNFAAITGSNPGALLEDAAFDIDITKGRKLFRVHAGQFKVPFGGQELTSSGSQQFVDRALASNSLFRGRDAGVAVWGVTPGSRLEWRVGVFNGNGQTCHANDNNKFQYNARVMWQPNGREALDHRSWASGALYSESDFESTAVPIYAVALNWENQDNFNATSGNDLKWNALAVDGIFKFKGFSVTGMLAWADRTPEIGESFSTSGGFIQAGKLFSRRRFEVAVRYGRHEPAAAAGASDTREIRGAFNYYHARHGLKWQTDAGHVEAERGGAGAPVRTFEVRSQLQFVF